VVKRKWFDIIGVKKMNNMYLKPTYCYFTHDTKEQLNLKSNIFSTIGLVSHLFTTSLSTFYMEIDIKKPLKNNLYILKVAL